MKKSRNSPPIEYSKLSPAELDAITAKFDREFIADEATPLTPAMRELDRRARRKRGRPRTGEGAEKIRISLERSILRRADAEAREQGLSRSQFIARTLQYAMRKAG